MQTLSEIIASFNEFFTFFILIPLIFILGLYLSIQLRFIQALRLKLSLHYLLKSEKGSKGNITHFEAISAVLAGNFGTGNISGMALAIAAGGPGSLVWMWVMAFLGAVIQYASCLLGLKYREVNSDGEYHGGPMYYLSKGLKKPYLAVIFAICAALAAFTVGNFAQVNSVVLPLKNMEINPLLSSLVITGFVGFVILGGMHRFALVAASVVPLMALLYLGSALVILALNFDKLLPALQLMLYSSFSNQAVAGGALGYGIVKVITTGFGRGMFATDAGTGIAPIIQSSSKTVHAPVEGLIAMLPPFLVMIVCTVTGLVLIVTGASQVPGLTSTNMCTYAFEKGLGGNIGGYIVIVSLILFAFTTILAWACCGERAMEYLFGKRSVRPFRYIFIAVIPVGAIAHVDFIWLIADMAVSCMMATNLIAIIGLASEVIEESRNFFQNEISLSSRA